LIIAQFIKNFEDGTAENEFHEDLEITRVNNVNGFPSFLIKSDNGKKVLLKGYQSYDNFRAVIDYLTNGKLTEKNIEGTEESIFDFINNTVMFHKLKL